MTGGWGRPLDEQPVEDQEAHDREARAEAIAEQLEARHEEER